MNPRSQAALVARLHVHRDVGVGDQLVRRRAVGGAHGGADRDPHPHRLHADREGRREHARKPAPHQLDHAVRIGGRQARQEDHELVATQPEHRVAGAHDAGQALRGEAQQRVTGCVAVGVVDRLEHVEVAEEQAQQVVGPALRELARQPALERRPVGQAGERVVGGVVQRPLLTPLQIGDVGQHDDLGRPALEPGHAALGRVAAAGAVAVEAGDLDRVSGPARPPPHQVDGLRREVIAGPQPQRLVGRPPELVAECLVDLDDGIARAHDHGVARGLRQEPEALLGLACLLLGPLHRGDVRLDPADAPPASLVDDQAGDAREPHDVAVAVKRPVGQARDAPPQHLRLGGGERIPVAGMHDARGPEPRHGDHVHRLMAEQVAHAVVDEFDRERIGVSLPDDRVDVAQEVEEEAGDVGGEGDGDGDPPFVAERRRFAVAGDIHHTR
jgi:hypothetical protein